MLLNLTFADLRVNNCSRDQAKMFFLQKGITHLHHHKLTSATNLFQRFVLVSGNVLHTSNYRSQWWKGFLHLTACYSHLDL